MEEIKQFKYKSENQDIIKVANVKEELIRPYISYNLLFNFENSFLKTKEMKVSRTQLDFNYFEKEELMFISKTYGVKFVEKEIFDGTKRLFSSNHHKNILYNSPGDLVYIEKKNNTILFFEFQRWQTKFQPRGPGEDYLGMDTRYVHSIWKDPVFLNDAMLQKIKSRIR